MVFLVAVVVAVDGFWHGRADHVDTQQDDDGRNCEGRQRFKQRIEVDVQCIVEERQQEGVQQDIDAQQYQQDAAQQMTGAEEIDHLTAGEAVQRKDVAVLREHLIGHRAQIEGVKEGIEPDDRQQKCQKAQSQQSHQRKDEEEGEHQRHTAAHISKVHLSGAREQTE